MEISQEEATQIGRKIFFNECSGKKDLLIFWNQGENFPSLGIGHFIWYPKGVKGPYQETFPALIAFFKENKVELPEWLRAEEGSPWRTREELATLEKKKKAELQNLLSLNLPLQTQFMVKRWDVAMQNILASSQPDKKERILRCIHRLEESIEGKFALIDYLNFKGDGTLETERYRGQGWGLLQVLEQMPLDATHPVEAFAQTAKSLLKARVKNAPFVKDEQRFLKGWLLRVDRYPNAF